MATAAEMARAEAERVEAAEREAAEAAAAAGEPGPDGEVPSPEELDAERDDAEPAEPETGEQPEQGEPPEPTEAMFGKVRAANERHHEKVRSIMGGFVDGFVECEACGGSGLTLPEPPGPSLQQAADAATCETCAGFGELTTGSRRQGYTLLQCHDCNGKGWQGPGNPTPEQAAAAAIASTRGEPPVPQSLAVDPAQPPVQYEDPRVAELRAAGYVIVPPPPGRS